MSTVRTDVLRLARESGTRLVRFLYCDTSAIVRGKSIYVRGLEDRLRSGVGLTVAMAAMSMLDQLAPIPELGPVGEVRLVPDPDTFATLPYLPNVAAMHADLLTLEHEPWAACPRGFLKRMLARLEGRGMRIRAAFEGEFSLGSREGDRFRPLDESLCFSTVGMDAAALVIDAMVAALEAQRLQVEQYYAELGPGQQELSIAHAEGLRAADNQITYRETVRGVAAQHGLAVSFAPKPVPEGAGNGCHLHFSLTGRDGRTSLFHDRKGPYGLSLTAQRFMAGVLAHAPALTALTCASVNSYRRLQPGSWSSAYACWGPDNREAALRVASPFLGSEAATINAELKSCDHTANPYLALGALIAAGLDGIVRELELAAPVLVDPATLPESEREAQGIRRLPGSLAEALSALETDEVLSEALGPLLLSAVLGVKGLEVELFAAQDAEFEIARHLFRY